MKKVNYVLVDTEIMPEIYMKVLEAKRLLSVGEVRSVKDASAMAGISRSAYYKYKDALFEYGSDSGEEIATLCAKLSDNAGVLSAFMSHLYKAGANVISVNQSVPVNGAADVTVTVRVSEMSISIEKLLEELNKIGGINNAVLS